jgi:hypothetical protein
MVVLLVYEDSNGPVSLVMHSQDGVTLLSMENQADKKGNDNLAGKIIQALGHPNNNISD